MEYGKKIEKSVKVDTKTFYPGIWQKQTNKQTKNKQKKLKKIGKWEMHTVGPGVRRENWKSYKNEKDTV